MGKTGATDSRVGSGQPTAAIRMRTLEIPSRCHDLCTWVVVKPGAGFAAVSELRYASAACGTKHEQVAAAAAASRGALP